jgi:hypothetical protein
VAKAEIPRDVLEGIAGPMDMAFLLAHNGSAPTKSVEDCDANEIRMRGIYHAVHYVQRRLAGWDQLPEDNGRDQVEWEKQTVRFEQMAAERQPDDATRFAWLLRDLVGDHCESHAEHQADCTTCIALELLKERKVSR